MNQIRTHRRAKGFTQQKLADLMGCSKVLVCQLESGVRNFTISTLMDWKDALHLTDEQLLSVLKMYHKNRKHTK